jgi:hypothetical protein
MIDPQIRGLAGELRRRGLAAPARLLLDVHRPLRPLLADLAVIVGPSLRPLLGRRLDVVVDALHDDDAYARLVDELGGIEPPGGGTR